MQEGMHRPDQGRQLSSLTTPNQNAEGEGTSINDETREEMCAKTQNTNTE